MRYISTRGLAPALGFADVLLAGLARDGGLYVPETWPRFTPEAIAELAGRPFHEAAVRVIEPFTSGEIAQPDLLVMARDAYAAFGHPAVTPLVQVDRNTWVLELFHGPTLAFKDVAMQLLARLMGHVLARRGQRATIVGATSGDTGGAAIEAFRGSPFVDVFILYPAGRVSDVQRRMMTTPRDRNVHAIAIEGTFDDCQALVKAMFNDHAFRDRMSLAGVNSINWARIVAQVSYYFVAAAALGAPYRAVSFAVPTGNFGNIFAGYVARRMGLPMERLVIGSNANDILPRAFETGTYEKLGVKTTMSPSMDIEVSSNFERYLFEAQGRDAALIRGQMSALGQAGRFEVKGGSAILSQDFAASAASEQAVADAIRRVRKSCAYRMDPHTACGYIAAERRLPDGATPKVVLATAHPAKFPDAMETILGERPELPDRLASLMTDTERTIVLPNDERAVMRAIEAGISSQREVSA